MLRRQIDSFFQRVLQILNGNLKTINGQSVVGSGNITVGGGGATWGGITGTLSSQTDLQTALNNKENLITAGTTSQYFRGDKTFQTLDKSAVGLGSVDNTDDLSKPVSTLQAAAIALKQDTLVSGTNIKTINSNSILGSGDLTISASAAGSTGQIQFNNSGAFAADSNLFWDNTNKRLGLGATPATNVRLDIRAQGTLSTDSLFRLRNSANTFDLLNINAVGLISGRTDGAGGFSMNYQGTANTTVQLTFNNGNPTLRVSGNGGQIATYTSNDNREYLTGLTGKATFAIGANPLGGTIKPNEANTNTMYVFNGTAPTLSATDSFSLYSADRGGTAGKASPHFRCEDGTIIVLGDFSGFGTSTPQARVDVRAQGVLSTDVAFRVRNSADTQDIININGTSLNFTGNTSGFTSFFNINRGATNVLLIDAYGIKLNSDLYISSVRAYSSGATIFRAQSGNGQININAYQSTISINNLGVIPTTSATDYFHFYCADIVAGNAAPHFRTENGSVIKLYRETTAIGAATFVANSGTAVNDASTFGGYTIAQIVKALQTQGLLA